MGQKGKGKKQGRFKDKRKRRSSDNRPISRKSKVEDSDGEQSDGSTGSGFEEVSMDVSESRPDSRTDKFASDESDVEEKSTRKMVMQQNRKQKKAGGFQAMGLAHATYTGIIRKGYKVPTPIQRKTIPLIMDGKDVVAMARTGSGKTAAFLIPMFEKLKTHASIGARALILSPTRELALQTLKFCKEIGKYTGLKSAVILGGDSLEDQFGALHENPDIIIATPGRFTHVLVEMEMKLNSIEYVVFDEADRLFEMGFQEQITEILTRLPESRQTVLFSATLPKLLVEFARAGLHDPTLIRLDVDSKLSENLKLTFLQCRLEDKMAALLYLLRYVVKPSEQTVVFAATKHHVEYINMVLLEAGISCSYTYSSLDQTARKIQVAKFRNKTTMVLIVTDLAARGIDIPMLDNVINYNFPAKPKLFVHRVGRVARAGRSGTAHNLISADEVSYVIDLHLFLGRPIKICEPNHQFNSDSDGAFGNIPQTVIDDEEENLRMWHDKIDFANMHKVTLNAYKNYLKSRPLSATESIKRAKELALKDITYHPLFKIENLDLEHHRNNLLTNMKKFRPRNTIFEINSTNKTQASTVMKNKRELHSRVIEANNRRRADVIEKELQSQKETISHTNNGVLIQASEGSSQQEIDETFHTILGGPKKKRQIRDEQHYIQYKPKDLESERGYSLGSSFEKDAASAMLDLTGDDENQSRSMKNSVRWDRKRKRFVTVDNNNDPKKKRVKTESGTWIKASYKSNAYKEWLTRSKKGSQNDHADSSDDEESGFVKKQHKKIPGRFEVLGGPKNFKGFKKGYRGESKKQKLANELKDLPGNRRPRSNELKRPEQILKQRRIKMKHEASQKHRELQRNKRKNVAGRKKGR